MKGQEKQKVSKYQNETGMMTVFSFAHDTFIICAILYILDDYNLCAKYTLIKQLNLVIATKTFNTYKSGFLFMFVF